MPENQVVDIDQAAHDLSLARRGDAETLEALEALELQRAIDELRAQPQATPAGQQPTEAQQQQTQQPTPDQQQTNAADDEVAKALKNPRVLAAVQDHVNQATQQAHAVTRAYAEATYANAAMAGMSLLSQFAELRGLSADQLPIAIETIRRTNPERGRAITDHVQQVTRMVEEASRANYAQQQAYQQAAQQQWQHYSTQQDNAYNAWVSKEVTAAERTAIEAEARQMIMDEYGANEQQVAEAWQTNPTLRSFQSQKFLFAAARDRLARKGINQKRDRSAPSVVHPGSPNEIRPPEDYSLRSLNDRLNKAGDRKSQLQAAAALVTARRSGRM